MNVLYFDCFSGISGDMTIAALLDLGIDADMFRDELKKLNLEGYDLVIEKKNRNGITGTDIQVILQDNHDKKQEEQNHNTDHLYHMRNLPSIETIIDTCDLSANVKDFSKKVFREIARAEAKVHNTAMEEVHFHEIGAIDSIIDIVGTGICLDLLGVQTVYSSPLHDGQGMIECQHGWIPVPVPAVVEMLAGSNIPLVMEDVHTELLTPTGMGIIKTLAAGFGKMPTLTITRTGYGMGKRETGKFNALRVVMGTLYCEEPAADKITVLETNIDDMSPELLGFAMESLFEAGALDVYYTPIYMKKNRPAVKLTVLINQEQEEKALDVILKQTSSLGVRKTTVQRTCMERETVTVETALGGVRIKIARQGDFSKISPEYEDCRLIAKNNGWPLNKVYELALKSFEGRLQKGGDYR